MAGSIKNIAASVHHRLLSKAKESSRPFNEILQHFAIERFIYRLSKNPCVDSFILKGALMFWAWSGPGSRPTMDIDLLGKIDNSLDVIVATMKDVCVMVVEPDGMSFNAETVTAARITEDAEYEGVRVRIQGGLGNARVSLQIDIGFGDVIVPGPDKVVYPTLLDFPAPELNGYTMESTIAEKFHAMVKLGILNSRMKDFYDIWMLSRTFDFSGEMLAEAVGKTFENRNTPIPIQPTVFNSSFINDQAKKSGRGSSERPSYPKYRKTLKLSSQPSRFSSNLSWPLLPRGGHSAGSGALPGHGVDRRYLTSVQINPSRDIIHFFALLFYDITLN